MRYALPIALCAALLAGCGGGDDDPEPAPKSNQLLDGGKAAFEKRLKAARGQAGGGEQMGILVPALPRGVPLLRAASPSSARGEVVFLGVDAEDNDSDAAKFLAEFPVDFPSFKDPESAIAASIDAATSFPTTVFFDSKGKQSYVRQGGYSSEQKLAEDIERYAR